MRHLLKKRRDSLKLTQAEVALRAGIPRVTYNLIEQGKRNPSLDTAIKIANALHSSLDSLFLLTDVTNDKQKQPK